MPNNAPVLGAVVTNTDPARFPGPEPLVGKYATLTHITDDHYADLWETIGCHPDAWAAWPDDAPATRALFDEYMQMLRGLSKDLVAYVVAPHSGPLKGRAAGLALGMSEDRETNRVGEMGAFFGPGLQRTPAATEAMYLLADLLFALNHRRVGWKTSSANKQSWHAAERYGFVYEGTLRQHQINKGRNRDTVWFSIIDSEWPLCKKAFEAWLDESNFDEQQKQKRGLAEIRASLK